MNFLTSTRGIQEQESGFSSAKGMYPFSQSSSSSQQIPLPLSYHNPRSSNESKELMLMDSSNNHGDSEPADEVVDHGTRANTASASVMIEREHMFDKVVTPSDVGKLNRLVIPKQHAEKYFPLDSSSNDHKAGLLLNFEDRNGKPWRFRYSYWNSSQSYVMTKGWSRFVKEKKLDAGDIVSFQRGAGELGKHRLFIDWRRRPDAPDHMMNPYHLSNWNHHHHRLFLQPFQTPSSTHSRLLLEGSSISQQHYSHYPHSYRYGIGNTSPYYDTCFSNTSTAAVVNANPCEGRSASQFVLPQQFEINMQMQRGSTVGVEPMVYNSVPVVQGKVAAKRLRLFGVNMDCPMISNLDDSDHDMFSSTTSLLSPTTTAVPYSHFSSSSTSTPNLLQSRNFNNYSPLQIVPPEELSDKGKASMSLDLDI